MDKCVRYSYAFYHGQQVWGKMLVIPNAIPHLFALELLMYSALSKLPDSFVFLVTLC